MGGRLQNSIDLAKSSWGVLRDDRKLAVLPLLSGLSALVVALAFFGPVALIVHNGAERRRVKPIEWILGVVGYVAVTYVAVFFNAALVFAADKRMRGEPVAIGEAVHAAGGTGARAASLGGAQRHRVGRAPRDGGARRDRRPHRRLARRHRVVARHVPRAPRARDRAARTVPGRQALDRAVQARRGART